MSIVPLLLHIIFPSHRVSFQILVLSRIQCRLIAHHSLLLNALVLLLQNLIDLIINNVDL